MNDIVSLQNYLAKLIVIKETSSFSDLIDNELKQNKNAYSYLPDKILLLKAIHYGIKFMN